MNKYFIKDFISRRRAKDHERRMDDLRSRFNVKEKGGIMWVMYDGVAISQIESTASSQDIADCLKFIRESAVKYMSL